MMSIRELFAEAMPTPAPCLFGDHGDKTMKVVLPEDSASIFFAMVENLRGIADSSSIFGAAILRIEFLASRSASNFEGFFLHYRAKSGKSFRSRLPEFHTLDSDTATQIIPLKVCDEHRRKLGTLCATLGERLGRNIAEVDMAREALRDFSLAYENQLAEFSAYLVDRPDREVLCEVPDATVMIDQWNALLEGSDNSGGMKETARRKLLECVKELDLYPLNVADSHFVERFGGAFRAAYPEIEIEHDLSPYEILSRAIELPDFQEQLEREYDLV